MKKIIFSILIMLLTTVSASAANPELTILPSCGSAGGQVEVTVEISESEVVGASFVVGYDDTVLSPVSVTTGSSIGTRTVAKNLRFDRDGIKGVKLSFFAKIENEESIPVDEGDLCTITFDVLTGDETVSSVYIADALLSDKDKQAMQYTVNSGMIYLNQFVCDAVFTKDGVETNKLSDSGMELNLGIFNGTNMLENSSVYVAQYSKDGTLVAIEKIDYSLNSGNDSKESIPLKVESNAETMKVMCWDAENIPFGGIFQIGR